MIICLHGTRLVSVGRADTECVIHPRVRARGGIHIRQRSVKRQAFNMLRRNGSKCTAAYEEDPI